MAEKALTILGSTGSIGRNTLDVVGRFPDQYRIHALAARSSIDLLEEQIRLFQPKEVAVFDVEAAQKLSDRITGPKKPVILSGMEGLIAVASAKEVDQVISGMVGAAGLRPTYAAIDAGKQVALANKETLVMAGEVMVSRALETGSKLLPVDSEHNAIFQCISSPPHKDVARIILTASGGPFRDLPLTDFPKITRDQALKHPTWSMGPKITIDSATMMNKGLEVIEARWLFGLPVEQIDVLVHPQSIVHSMVEYVDGSVIAQLGTPDMRTPISYSLAYPQRLALGMPSLNLAEVGHLDFKAVEWERYPCLTLALDALKVGGAAPAVLNGANEAVVAAYLDDKFTFVQIAGILTEAMTRYENTSTLGNPGKISREITTIDDAVKADLLGRELANQIIMELENG